MKEGKVKKLIKQQIDSLKIELNRPIKGNSPPDGVQVFISGGISALEKLERVALKEGLIEADQAEAEDEN